MVAPPADHSSLSLDPGGAPAVPQASDDLGETRPMCACWRPRLWRAAGRLAGADLSPAPQDRDRQYRQLLADRRAGPGGRTRLCGRSRPSAAPSRSGPIRWWPTTAAARPTASQHQDDEAIARPARGRPAGAGRAAAARRAGRPLRRGAATPRRPPSGTARRPTRLQDEDPALLYALALARYRAGCPGRRAIEPLRDARSQRNAAAWPRRIYLLGLVYRDARNVDGGDRSRSKQAVRLAPTLTAGARGTRRSLSRARPRRSTRCSSSQALATRDGQVAPPDRDRARRSAPRPVRRRARHADATAQSGAPPDSRVQLALGRVYLARAERTATIGRRLARGRGRARARARRHRAPERRPRALRPRAAICPAIAPPPSASCARPSRRRRSISRPSRIWPTRPNAPAPRARRARRARAASTRSQGDTAPADVRATRAHAASARSRSTPATRAPRATTSPRPSTAASTIPATLGSSLARAGSRRRGRRAYRAQARARRGAAIRSCRIARMINSRFRSPVLGPSSRVLRRRSRVRPARRTQLEPSVRADRADRAARRRRS